MTKQRIAAIIGIVLIVVGIVLMLCSSFLPENKTALINIGLICDGLGIIVFFLLKKAMHQDVNSGQE